MCEKHPTQGGIEQGPLLVPQNLISPNPIYRSRRSAVIVSSETVAVERVIFMKFKEKMRSTATLPSSDMRFVLLFAQTAKKKGCSTAFWGPRRGADAALFCFAFAFAFALLCFALLCVCYCLAFVCFASLRFGLLCFALLLLCSALLCCCVCYCFALLLLLRLLCFAFAFAFALLLLCVGLLCFALLCSALLCSALLCFALLACFPLLALLCVLCFASPSLLCFAFAN